MRINSFPRILVLACLTLTLALMFGAAPAMAQTFVQDNDDFPSTAVGFTTPQGVGDLNVVVMSWADATTSPTSVSDTAGNTYAMAVGTSTTGTGANAISQAIFYAANIKAGANTVTVHFNAAPNEPEIRVLEYSGVATTGSLTAASAAVGTGTTANSGSANTQVADSVVVAGGTTGGKFNQTGANFTIQIYNSGTGNLAGDLIATSAGPNSVSATLSAADTWIMQMAAFGTTATTLPAPTVATVITPNSGPDTGGTPVAITGTNFAPGATVLFGGLSGVNCAVASSTTINCLTPPENSGTVDVTVTNVDGQFATSTVGGGGGFDFQLQQPSVGTVTPATGSTNGSPATAPVTIAGANFLPGATVSVNEAQFEAQHLPAVQAGNVTVTNSGTITATLPAMPAIPAGTADVTVRNPDGGTNTGPGIFTYAANASGINFVQRADAATGSSSQNFQAPMLNPQTAGNLNVVIIGWGDTNASVSGVTDSEGNKYVQALPIVQSTGLSQVIYYAANIKGDSATPNTITVAFNRPAFSPDVRALEYSGLAANAPLDAAAGAFDQSASSLADTGSGACTTTAPGELVVAGASVGNEVAGPDPKFAMVDFTTNGNGAEQEILTAAGSCEATMPLETSEHWVIQAVTFKTTSADFSLTAGTQTPSMASAGSSASYAIAVTALNGFTGPVTFTTCAGLPTGDGLSCSVSPSSVTPGDSATLTINTSSTTPVNTYNNITVTGTSGNLTHTATVSLKVTAAAAPSFAVTATALSPASVAAGSPSTSTVTVTPTGGFTSTVALTCAITPATAVPPTCGFSSASVAGGSGTSTLTFTTVAATSSARLGQGLAAFYAMLLPLCGVTLLGASLTPRRKKLLGLLLVCLMLSGLVFLAACGGGSSSGGGGGGGGTTTPGTTSGTYTVTVTGTAGPATQTVTPALTVTVQ